MKTQFPLIKCFYLITTLMMTLPNCISQTKDSAEYKICIKKIQELYGSDADYSGPLTINQVEKEAMVTIEKDGKKVTIPFGFINDNWEEIKSKMKKGDKIFKFTTGPDSWANLAGREGYIVLRKAEVIGTIITTMN